MSGLRRLSDVALVGAAAGAVAGQLPVFQSSTGHFAPGQATAPGPTFNLTPQNYPNLRKAIGKIRAGLAADPIFAVGDSTTAGFKATSLAKTYPAVLASLMNQYVPSALTWICCNNAATPLIDPRITMGSHWSLSFGVGLLGNTSGISDTVSFTSAAGGVGLATVDTFEVYTFNGSFTANIDGSAPLTGSSSWTSGGTVLDKHVLTVAAGTGHVLNLTTTSGFVTEVNAYLSTSPVLQFCNIGQGSTTAPSWDASAAGTGNKYHPAWWATNFHPALTIIDIGINDAGASKAPATFQTQVQTMITQGLATGDVLLKSMAPSNNTPYTTFEPQYLTVFNALALANNLAFLDGYSRWTSYAASNALGYYSAADNLHPSDFGYSDIAGAVYGALKTL